MSDPRLDLQLSEYLDAERRSRAEGHTIANVRIEVHELSRTIKGINARVAALEVGQDDVHDRLDTHAAKITHHAAEIVTIKRRIRSGDDDEEMSTGRFDVEEIKRELAAVRQSRKDSERAKSEEITWWKRSLIGWVALAMGFVASTAITVLITLAILGRK